MVNCESFESNFGAWQEGKLEEDLHTGMEHHASNCDHCAKFNGETHELRDLLRSSSVFEPTTGFDFRLQRRISEVVDGKAYSSRKNRTLIPRWAAMGAGLATGAAIGLALLLPSDQGNPGLSKMIAEAADPVSVSSNDQLIADTSMSENDSTDQDMYLLDLDRMSQTVSTEQQGR